MCWYKGSDQSAHPGRISIDKTASEICIKHGNTKIAEIPTEDILL
jgi:hypothetical protein